MKDTTDIKGKALDIDYSNINLPFPSYALYLNHFVSLNLMGIICIAGKALP